MREEHTLSWPSLAPNQLVERTPPRCALRRRTSALGIIGALVAKIPLASTLMAILLLPICSQAQPDAVLQYLMNEPVTMLDRGFDQLRKRLDGFARSDSDSGPKILKIKISLDFDGSLIEIRASSIQRA